MEKTTFESERNFKKFIFGLNLTPEEHKLFKKVWDDCEKKEAELKKTKNN